MQRPVVLLPQPLSPTTPSVSPAARSKLTPSTACTLSTVRLSSPPLIGKCLTRFLTFSSGSRHGPCAQPRIAECTPPCAPAPPRAAAAWRCGTRASRTCSGRRSGSPRPGRSAWAPCRESPPAAPCAWPRCRCAGCCGSAPACRGGAAARRVRSTGASSTTLPAYITTTRCAVSATTPIAWVISITAMPSRSLSSAIRSRICAWIVTSSAVVGSSAISSLGLQASAMAIITRWRMPPENWCG